MGIFLANSFWEKGGILARNLRRCRHLVINLFGPPPHTQKKTLQARNIIVEWLQHLVFEQYLSLMYTWQLREDLSISLLKGHEILFCWGTWASLLLKDMKILRQKQNRDSMLLLHSSFYFLFFPNSSMEPKRWASQGRFRLNWQLFWAKEARASIGSFWLNCWLFWAKEVRASLGRFGLNWQLFWAKEARTSLGRFGLNWRLFWAKEVRASLGRFRLNWQLFSRELINVSPVAWIWWHHHCPPETQFSITIWQIFNRNILLFSENFVTFLTIFHQKQKKDWSCTHQCTIH